MLKTLREPRYAAFSALMIVVALACIGAGTWQIYRFEQKRVENHELRRNAHAAATEVAQVLPLVGTKAPSRFDVQLRMVRATGRYDPTLQTLVRNRSVDDVTGFYVVTPFRTDGRVLLVVRGFLPQSLAGALPRPPAPPLDRVTITARAEPRDTKADAADQLRDHQVESINPAEQARRIGAPVYNAYAELLAGQPGVAGMQAVPAPSMGNPAGGAVEPQHFAYVIQWYLFALLALAAPIVMARSESKQGPTAEFDTAREEPVDEPASEPIPEATPEERRAAKLADRYGRPVRR